jgi:hypothetical protein
VNFRRFSFLFLALIVSHSAGAAGGGSIDNPSGPVRVKKVVTESYVLDKKYASMAGPSSTMDVRLLDTPEPEILWITGIEGRIVDADDVGKEMPPELICHANVDIDARRHRLMLGFHNDLSPKFNARYFTLAQGQTSIQFPDGFGMPVRSDESLALWTQVLNPYDKFIGAHIKQEITFTFIRDSERTAPITPLRFTAVQARVALDDVPAYYSLASHEDRFMPITGAAVEGFPQVQQGEAAADGAMTDEEGHRHTMVDGLGRKYAAHYIVPPGRNENRTVINSLMGLNSDLRIHYVSAHLHPYATSIEIRDMTTGDSVFQADVESSADGKALTKIHNYVSEEPITLRADHDYELISIYENTSEQDVTAMSVLHFYAVFDEFDAARFVRM